jgi:hypothetical protein
MNKNSKLLEIYLSAMLIATSVATALRTVACVKMLDYSSGLFTDRSLVTASNAIMLLLALGMLSYVVVASRVTLCASFSTGATYVPTGILGVATAFIGIKVFYHAMESCNYRFFSKEVFTFKSPATLVGVIVAVLALLSIAHHFFNAFTTDAKDTVRAYFATATIAFLAFYAIEVYIDGTLAVNDPSKVLRQITFMICAAFFVFEARISLGREKWRLYTAFGLVAASLTAYASIPAIVTYYINGEIINASSVKSLASLEEYVLLLALFIFIVSRLCLTVFLREEKENALVKALGEYAKEREERVNDSYERFQELFASKQLSIFDLYGGDEELSGAEEPEEETPEIAQEEEKKEITISDDAIYEAIFGKMPERPEENEAEKSEPEPEDERAPEQIAEDILNALDEALNEYSDSKEKETEI